MHVGQQSLAVTQTEIRAVGLHAGSKNVGYELESQPLPGHILTLVGQQFIFLFLILYLYLESCQSCFQLTEHLVLLTNLPILFTNLCGNVTLLHGTSIQLFVYHRDNTFSVQLPGYYPQAMHMAIHNAKRLLVELPPNPPERMM